MNFVEEAAYFAARDLVLPRPEQLWIVHLFRRLVECQRYCDIQPEAGSVKTAIQQMAGSLPRSQLRFPLH